jgi:restriction system protein
MARSYRRSKGGDQATLILPILLGGVIWAHRAILPTIEHWAVIACLVATTTVAAAILIRPIRSAALHRRQRAMDIAGVDSMDGLSFERYIASLLKRQGYTNVKLTERYDLGVDIIADKNGVRWGIQVKRYSGLVKALAVRQVVTGLRKYGCDRAMVITNSSFSRVATELAESNDCILVTRKELARWIGSKTGSIQ